jgi:predicted histone-like DNA-binding protein
MIAVPIKYNTVERGNPARPESGKKFYPSIQSTGRVKMRQLAEKAARMSTLSTVDMAAAIESFLAIIPEELANGNIVDLGEFGNFWLRTTSKGAGTAREVSGDQITSLIVRFNAGKQFKRVLRSVEFEKEPKRGKKR